MYYVMIPEYYDNYTLYPRNKKAKCKTLIAHELLTISEYIKHHETYDNMPNLTEHTFKISKSNVYTSFGCRFLSHDYDYRKMEHVDYFEAPLMEYYKKSGLKKA